MLNENTQISASEIYVTEALNPGFPTELPRIFVTTNPCLEYTPRISDPSL